MDILSIYHSLPDGARKEIAARMGMTSPGVQNRLLRGDRAAWEMARDVLAAFSERNTTLETQVEELLRVRIPSASPSESA